MISSPVTIYFDGACPLCSREIAHYRKKDTAGRLRYVDIASPSFDAAAHGLDAKRVQKLMHVQLPDGKFATGVDAFIAIWNVLPGYEVMGKVAKLPLVKPLLHLAYRAFAAVRPHLPKRHKPGDKTSCPDDRCAV